MIKYVALKWASKASVTAEEDVKIILEKLSRIKENDK